MMHKTDKLTKYQREFSAVDYIHDYGLDPEKREIYLFGSESHAAGSGENVGAEPGVEYTMANTFIKNLRVLQGLGSEPILIHMKTCGGDWYEGMAIYQAIAACPCYITILNYTHARSMSSIIFQAADSRAMMPYSTFMFHDGAVAQHGTVKQFFTEAQQQKQQLEYMFEIYLDRAESGPRFKGKNRHLIKKWMRDNMDRKEDVYLNPKETIDCGFADFIFGEDHRYDWQKLKG